MTYTRALILLTSLFLLCGCSLFKPGKAGPAPAVSTPRPLAVPVGDNWQIIEEAPRLSNEGGRLPFQMEQSVQPPGTQPLTPAEKRTIETPR